MASLAVLLEKIKEYNKQPSHEFITEVYQFAAQAHEGQTRNSGEPYITHPLAVAIILTELELDQITIAAGLLHDVIEDTAVTREELVQKFGEEVALLVDGVTKLNKLEYKSKEEHQAENLRKMFMAMAKDIRVILIKLADRLHNMRTLKYQSARKQKEVARETLEVFAPLANRLGIFKVKWELEDLCLRYLEPETYYELVERIAKKRAEREEYISGVTDILQEKLDDVGIKADIQGRPKHFYSIYKKMWDQNKDLSEIYDLIAVRVVVDSVKDCYGALGTVHTLWKPIPGRFKDFIAMPKSNMYQSLHTTVIGATGEPFEIQIRTWEMHRTSEYGIAAHWRYKEGKGDKNRETDDKFSWLRQLIEWQKDLRDAKEFMETLKIDLFEESVFVFTPKGQVIELPAGSIPIDYAYRIHTDVGHRCTGAKINGKMVTLDYKLNTGDIVEIITSRQTGPSRDWLNIVKTPAAKNRIRQWFKREQRDEHIIRGKETLEKEARKQGLDPIEHLKEAKLVEIAKQRFNLLNLEDIYAAIGDGAITANQILFKIKEEKEKREKEKTKSIAEQLEEVKADTKSWGKATKDSHGIMVKGMSNMLIRLAKCCNPVPGDRVVGYITRGKGVSVHRADCQNVLYHSIDELDRMVDVAWDTGVNSAYLVKLEVDAMDRAGLLTDVLAVLVEFRISATDVHARGIRNNRANIDLALEIKNTEQLELIISRIRKVKDVYDVRRVTPGS